MGNLVSHAVCSMLKMGTVAALQGCTVLLVPLVLRAQEVQISEDIRSHIEGDYTVTVYPEPFGFFFEGDTLYLKVGGVESDGRAAPLLAQGRGRFKIALDHPNVFQFEIVDDEVRFTFWAGSNSDAAAINSSPDNFPIVEAAIDGEGAIGDLDSTPWDAGDLTLWQTRVLNILGVQMPDEVDRGSRLVKLFLGSLLSRQSGDERGYRFS